MISANDYLYYGEHCVIEDVTWNLKSEPKLRIRLDTEESFKPFSAITKRRGKKAGQILQIKMRYAGSDCDFFSIDAWFAGWTVSHNKGTVIACTIDDETFDQLRVLEHGSEVEMVVYQIEDDGTSHNEERRAIVEAKLKGGPLSVQCAKACREAAFHRYLTRVLKNSDRQPMIDSEKLATTTVREICGVDSRALIDHDADAREKWKKLYRGYLREYV